MDVREGGAGAARSAGEAARHGAAGQGAFSCDQNHLDFLCGGPSFDCLHEFVCAAGHMFMCSHDHECMSKFSGTSTGNPACDDIHPYAIPDRGRNDTTAGDFICGSGKGGTGGLTFDCSGEFVCEAKDEFDCRGKTNFDCASSFRCGAEAIETKFECDMDFDCQTQGSFDCVRVFSGMDKSPDEE